MQFHQNEVLVIGGGHAGIEAACSTATLGVPTTLVTLRKDRIGFMSCNPAIGGIAKGQLVREIDALGGRMGEAIDATGIQFRLLNSTKGPAVRSPRAQADKDLYALFMLNLLERFPNLTVIEGEVGSLKMSQNRVKGAFLVDGSFIPASSVIVTAGTFLRAVMFVGSERKEGGRRGDQASSKLSEQLLSFGIGLGRFKTGTPPRLKNSSINWSSLETQPGDLNPRPFSFFTNLKDFPKQEQISCALTYTNMKVHEIIENSLHLSPLFQGEIKGLGPRYCPSIEDKVVRFHDKERHQIFLEPEGLSTESVYVNGMSTSLPRETQEKFFREIPGLEACEFLQFGYAVEYDYILSHQLSRSLELDSFDGLFFAGQVNGTSGYEEAAAQGLGAGINAALRSLKKPPFSLTRTNSYIGVLIDDLIIKGTSEPYRMFTSRAEHRLYLRSDNADQRLCPISHELGLLSEEKWEKFQRNQEERQKIRKTLEENYLFHVEQDQKWLKSLHSTPLLNKTSFKEILKRPEIRIQDLLFKQDPSLSESPEVETVEIEIKYEGYLEKERKLIEKADRQLRLKIPKEFNYRAVSGLSHEIIEKLESFKPDGILEASRISGVTPAAIAILSLFLIKKTPQEPNKRELRKQIKRKLLDKINYESSRN